MNALPSKIAVIGAGAWGTALAVRLARKHSSSVVALWGRDITEFKATRKSPLFPDLQLPTALVVESEIALAVNGAQVVVIAIPSEALTALGKLIPSINADTIVVSAVKGFEPLSLTTPLTHIEHLYGDAKRLCVLSGPSFAKDVVKGLPASIVAASVSEDTAKFVANLFSDETLRVYSSTDPIGVEVGGATKNVVAVAAGVCAGLGLGDSARAGLITRGLAEMMRIAEKIGAKDIKTLSGLSGLGDLIMTASSELSRNFRAGELLAQGKSTQETKQIIGSTIEGFSTALNVEKLCARIGAQVVLTPVVAKIVRGEISPKQAVQELLSRPLKSEF